MCVEQEQERYVTIYKSGLERCGIDGALLWQWVVFREKKQSGIGGFLYGTRETSRGFGSEAEAAGHCHAPTALLASRPTRACSGIHPIG